MTWLWIVPGVIAALIVVPMIVGFLLPQKYEARVRMTVKRPPADVWAEVSDYRKHPLTGSQRKKVEALPDRDGLPAWVEDMGSSQVTVETVEALPPGHLVRRMTDSVVPMSARSEIQIEEVEGGSRVTAINQTEVRNGTWHVPIFRIILSLGGAKKSARDYLSGVAQGLGETAQFE